MTTPEVILKLASVQSFPEVLALLYDARYTGRVILHCVSGTPAKVEIPSPPPPAVQVVLTPGKPPVRTKSPRKA